jgi:hypothetical protein
LQFLAHVAEESSALDTADTMTSSSNSNRSAAHRDFTGSMFCRNTNTHIHVDSRALSREERNGRKAVVMSKSWDRMEDNRNTQKVLMEKPEGQKSL